MRTHCGHVGGPEMRELLEWCPMDGKQIFPGTLPLFEDKCTTMRTIRSVNQSYTPVVAGERDEVELA
ncbi:hypothetical protein BC826DRAFT_1036601 [Russula brevipes]|nr:hypothetical protein BC826DRAFT_1036601 [Russula brevipes]